MARSWNPVLWNPTHWGILAAFVASLGAQVSAVGDWAELTQPLFVGGVIAQLASLLAALYAHPPEGPLTDPDWKRPTPR